MQRLARLIERPEARRSATGAPAIPLHFAAPRLFWPGLDLVRGSRQRLNRTCFFTHAPQDLVFARNIISGESEPWPLN
jgi:hypothetical protein